VINDLKTKTPTFNGYEIILNDPVFKQYRDFLNGYTLPKDSNLTHKHHIIPRSLGGNNRKENLIRLTIEDHIEAHRLLAEGAKSYGDVQVIHATNRALRMIQGTQANIVNMDIFDLLAQVSKSAFQLFNQIKLNRDPETNICVLAGEFNTPSQKAAFSRSFNELKRKNIIRRVKTAYYKKDKNEQAFILNPDLFKTFDINKAQEIWFNC